MNYIERRITPAIERSIKGFPVITVTGPRQSGKSTLLRHIFPEARYITLEDPDTLGRALSDPRSVLNLARWQIIDEVQRAPQLLSYIQGIVDLDPQRRFLLSGSSQFQMLKGVSQSLAGRTAIYELLPLSYTELESRQNDINTDRMLFNGFFPAIWSRDVDPTDYLRAYTKTYLERDVHSLLNVKDMHQFSQFLRMCAGRVGSIFVASDLSDAIGVSVNTIKSWLSVLIASYLVFPLQPYSANLNKRLVKSPKLYFVDTGLLCYLLGMERSEQLEADRMRGQIFENFMVMETIKHQFNRGRDSEAYFYRDSNGNEVDLMLRSPLGLHCFEIKSSQTYHETFEKGLRSFRGAVKEPVASCAVVYAGENEYLEGEIKIVNYKHFNQQLESLEGSGIF